jgi:hypothetical protein
MSAHMSSPLAVEEETFEGRWARWVADGRKADETLHRRAVGAVVVIAAAFVIAALWVLTQS